MFGFLSLGGGGKFRRISGPTGTWYCKRFVRSKESKQFVRSTPVWRCRTLRSSLGRVRGGLKGCPSLLVQLFLYLGYLGNPYASHMQLMTCLLVFSDVIFRECRFFPGSLATLTCSTNSYLTRGSFSCYLLLNPSFNMEQHQWCAFNPWVRKNKTFYMA